MSAPAAVQTVRTDDGVVVRLSGHLGTDAVPGLREALLRVRPQGCDDVAVDAAAVTGADDAALAVLLAAGTFVPQTGGRLHFVAAPSALRVELGALGPVALEDRAPALAAVR